MGDSSFFVALSRRFYSGYVIGKSSRSLRYRGLELTRA